MHQASGMQNYFANIKKKRFWFGIPSKFTMNKNFIAVPDQVLRIGKHFVEVACGDKKVTVFVCPVRG